MKIEKKKKTYVGQQNKATASGILISRVGKGVLNIFQRQGVLTAWVTDKLCYGKGG